MSKEEMREKVLELQRQGKLPPIEGYLKAWDEASAIFRPKILALREQKAKRQRLQRQKAARRKQ